MTGPSAFLTLRLVLRSTMPLLISPLLILIRISLTLFIQFIISSYSHIVTLFFDSLAN